MLISLHVRNLALIEEEEVTFTDGLNILTGETGAGKSILIGSVNLALGAKADRNMIRTGAEQALVEMTFAPDNEAQLQKLRDMDIDTEEDGLTDQAQDHARQERVLRQRGDGDEPAAPGDRREHDRYLRTARKPEAPAPGGAA